MRYRPFASGFPNPDAVKTMFSVDSLDWEVGLDGELELRLELDGDDDEDDSL